MIYRVPFVIAGIIVTLAGVVMLITPGPAFAVIPAGLAMLSMEFAWAERHLEWTIVKGEQAKQKATNASTTSKVFAGLAAAFGAGAVVAWAVLADIPLLPV